VIVANIRGYRETIRSVDQRKLQLYHQLVSTIVNFGATYDNIIQLIAIWQHDLLVHKSLICCCSCCDVVPTVRGQTDRPIDGPIAPLCTDRRRDTSVCAINNMQTFLFRDEDSVVQYKRTNC